MNIILVTVMLVGAFLVGQQSASEETEQELPPPTCEVLLHDNVLIKNLKQPASDETSPC